MSLFVSGGWHEIVTKYSTRQLTYNLDKLLALSALVRETAELCGDDDEYLAGLWRSTLPCDLCWSSCERPSRISEEYLAPSWSWASSSADIHYQDVGVGCGYWPAVELKDARLKFATADTCGAVHDEWIHLLGHLKPVRVIQVRTSAEQRRAMWPMIVRDADGDSLHFVDHWFAKLDTVSFLTGGSKLVSMFCVPLIKFGWDRPETERRALEFWCLLLVPNGSIKHTRPGETFSSPKTRYSDDYQRAGLSRMRVNNRSAFKAWLGESARRTL